MPPRIEGKTSSNESSNEDGGTILPEFRDPNGEGGSLPPKIIGHTSSKGEWDIIENYRARIHKKDGVGDTRPSNVIQRGWGTHYPRIKLITSSNECAKGDRDIILPEYMGTNPPEFRDTHPPISPSIGIGKGDTRPPRN